MILNGEAGERCVRVRLDATAVAVLAVLLPLLGRHRDARDVHRRRQIVEHRVEQRLDALVLEGGAAEHRAERTGDGAGLDRPLERLDSDVTLVEILLHASVIDGESGVEEKLTRLLRLLHQVVRDRLVMELGAQIAALPDDRLHFHQIDHADELVLDTDRQLQGQCHDIELLLQRVEGAVEVRAGSVELVDEDDTGHVVAVGQAPVGLGLRLHAGDALDDEHRAVQDAQAAVDLDVEVDVARRVDDVDAVLLPLARHRRGGDGDPPLPLLLHVVGRGVAVMHLTDPVRHAGVVQNPLGRGRLARVDMCGDADIANAIERGRGHGMPPSGGAGSSLRVKGPRACPRAGCRPDAPRGGSLQAVAASSHMPVHRHPR